MNRPASMLSLSYQPHSIPNLEDIRQDNDGGVIAISGLDYQFHFAAHKCIEMLLNPGKYEFVSSETHEDVVVKFCDGTYDFYQVKLKSNEMWDLNELNSRQVWNNFIKVREKFGERNRFWFVSDQTARYSSRKGKRTIPDLGKMEKLTKQGVDICNQSELDKNDVAALLSRLHSDWGFASRATTEEFFWSIRILTKYEREKGLESCNLRDLQRVLELRSLNVDSNSLMQIYDSIMKLLRGRVKPPDTATYEQAIEMRKVRPADLEKCFQYPIAISNLNHFQLDGIHEEQQRRDLRQKATVVNPKLAEYFIESRNYFAFLYRQQHSSTTSYVAQLRLAVWSVCQRQKVYTRGIDRPIQTYETILRGLEELAKREQNKQPPFEVSFDYLHGMMCQLTAECLHDWYPLN